MKKYLFSAVVVAALSLVLTLLSLASLYGFNPFGLSMVSRYAELSTPSDTFAYVQAVSGVATAIATIFALVVGAIAIIAVIESERSEHKTVEQIKVDVASLAGVALSLRNRVFLYTNSAAIDPGKDIFQDERQKMTSILTSPTGLAVYLWSGDDRRMTDNDIFSALCGLVDCLTLRHDENVQAVLNLVAQRASVLIKSLSQITEAQFKSMVKPLSHLGDGLSHAAQAVEKDPFAQLQADMEQRHLDSFRAPSKEEVAHVMEAARQRIGGQADKTVEHFGLLAIDGEAKDRAMFHQLVHGLFHMGLDEFMTSKNERDSNPGSSS